MNNLVKTKQFKANQFAVPTKKINIFFRRVEYVTSISKNLFEIIMLFVKSACENEIKDASKQVKVISE